MPQEETITVQIKNLQTALRVIEVAREERARLNSLLMDEADPINANNISEAIRFIDGTIKAQETQLNILFDVNTIKAVRSSLPKIHILQTILEEVFQCSASNGSVRGLMVDGDLGDIMSHIIRNTTENNREELGQAMSWIDANIDNARTDTVIFPYVTYVEVP
jgi:hypothetical protein